MLHEAGLNLSAAERLMVVAQNAVLTNPATLPSLPPSREALYELTKISDAPLARVVELRLVTPEMTVAQARKLRLVVKERARTYRGDNHDAWLRYWTEVVDFPREPGNGEPDARPYHRLTITFWTQDDFEEFARRMEHEPARLRRKTRIETRRP